MVIFMGELLVSGRVPKMEGFLKLTFGYFGGVFFPLHIAFFWVRIPPF